MRLIYVLIVVGAIVALAGCTTNSPLVDPLLGKWHTEVLTFDNTVEFASNGTGTIVNTLGTTAFEWKKIDSTHMNFRKIGDSDWDTKTYQLVNSNTLQFDGLTYTRV